MEEGREGWMSGRVNRTRRGQTIKGNRSRPGHIIPHYTLNGRPGRRLPVPWQPGNGPVAIPHRRRAESGYGQLHITHIVGDRPQRRADDSLPLSPVLYTHTIKSDTAIVTSTFFPSSRTTIRHIRKVTGYSSTSPQKLRGTLRGNTNYFTAPGAEAITPLFSQHRGVV